tara:strand:+ start:32 stop:304 length:273 start_codon:yes stop_codon:yes gene_type:complete
MKKALILSAGGYIFTVDNDADVMHNSATINLNIANLANKHKAEVLFYSSSAYTYPDNQLIFQKLNWKPDSPLNKGMRNTYSWINKQLNSI